MIDPNLYKLGKIEETSKALIITNIIGIIIAVVLNFNFATVVWIYFIESVLIGVFTLFTFITRGIRTGAKKGILGYAWVSIFFIISYGFIHFMYFAALSYITLFSNATAIEAFDLDLSHLGYILLTSGILFLSHGFSFFKNVILKASEDEKPESIQNVKKIFESVNRPFYRVIPIHIIIMISGFGAIFIPVVAHTVLLVVFMGVKAYADLYAHQKKHNLLVKE
jgi:hypothetical protein